MTAEQRFELQAYLDGELSRGDARRIEQWLAQDRDAAALLAELKITKGSRGGNEPVVSVPVPESREFYWSKIQRAIESAERADQPATEPAMSWWLSWRRYMAPISGLALVAILAISI